MMKKIFVVLTVVGIALASFGWVGVTQAFAQTPTPPTPVVPNQPGLGRGAGMMSGNRGSGLLQNYMLSAMASVFGLTEDELQTQLNGGKTMYQIAQEQGLTSEEFYTKMTEVRSEALNKALADGIITQDAADWMLSHMGGRGNRAAQGGFGSGMCGYGAGFGTSNP